MSCMHEVLDKRISGKFSELEENEGSLPELEKRVAALEAENATSWSRRCEIDEEIERLRNEISYIRSGQQKVDFLIDLIPIAQKYVEPPKPIPEKSEGGGILGFVRVESRSGSRALLKEFEGRKKNETTTTVTDSSQCVECGGQFRIHEREASRTCVQCGLTEADEYSWIHNLSYNEEISRSRTSSYAYKKINHFAEWLASVQAKEKTTIPDEVLDALRAEYKKIRVTTASQITASRTKEFLKKLKMTKYYEHVHYITELLSGIPPVSIPPDLEERLKLMFHEIQEPWEKTKPADRSNFFSYSYVLHKFCELLGEDEYLSLFPLLKSSQKLYQQDKMWKSVCAELGWEFISSV
jgi:hypothetical protein